jgi:hypothetical protein
VLVAVGSELCAGADAFCCQLCGTPQSWRLGQFAPQRCCREQQARCGCSKPKDQHHQEACHSSRFLQVCWSKIRARYVQLLYVHACLQASFVHNVLCFSNAGTHDIGRSGPKPDNPCCDGWISFPGVDKSISRQHAVNHLSVSEPLFSL